MATLELTNQATAKNQIKAKTDQLIVELDKRREIWNKLPLEKKKAFLAKGLDPVLSLAWDLYRYLDRNFFGEQFHETD